MLTGQSVQACPRREVPTDHEAQGQRSTALLKSRSDSASAGDVPGARSSTREARSPHTQALSDSERTSAERQRARNERST